MALAQRHKTVVVTYTHWGGVFHCWATESGNKLLMNTQTGVKSTLHRRSCSTDFMNNTYDWSYDRLNINATIIADSFQNFSPQILLWVLPHDLNILDLRSCSGLYRGLHVNSETDVLCMSFTRIGCIFWVTTGSTVVCIYFPYIGAWHCYFRNRLLNRNLDLKTKENVPIGLLKICLFCLAFRNAKTQ